MDRVNWVVSECLHAAARLRVQGCAESASPAALHASACRRVDRMLARAAEAGFGSEDARLMAYAVVGLLDEVAMAEDGPLRAHWAGAPLQRVYFEESVAGERFFEHLARVQSDPGRLDVLRVFHLALSLGFEGRYRVEGAQHELLALRAGVRAQLLRRLAPPVSLSPDLYAAVERPAPERLAVRWGTTCALLALLVVVLGMRVSLATSARSLEARLHAALVLAPEEGT